MLIDHGPVLVERDHTFASERRTFHAVLINVFSVQCVFMSVDIWNREYVANVSKDLNSLLFSIGVLPV